MGEVGTVKDAGIVVQIAVWGRGRHGVVVVDGVDTIEVVRVRGTAKCARCEGRDGVWTARQNRALAALCGACVCHVVVEGLTRMEVKVP